MKIRSGNVYVTVMCCALFAVYSYGGRITVTDGFGREVNEHGVTLADWQGHLMNPKSRLTLAPPSSGVRYPLTVTIKATGTSRLMLNQPSTLSAAGAEKTVTFDRKSSRVDVQLAIAPDRAGGFGEIETYDLIFMYAGRRESVPIKVIDLDDDLEPLWPLVFDYRPDTITDFFSRPERRKVSETAIRDWFYFFDYPEPDPVPAGDERASVTGNDWKNHETFFNDKPYTGFWVFKRAFDGPYATGYPNNVMNPNKHFTEEGVELPGRLPRSSTLIMHDNPKANWFFSIADEEWYQTKVGWGGYDDLYGLTMHEFGHAIVFHEYLPGFREYIADAAGAQRVIAYQGAEVPYGGSGHIIGGERGWDRLSGHSAGYDGLFPPRRWMLTKLTLLIAQEVGWKLREIGPFIPPQIETDVLSDTQPGASYSEKLRSNNGGVPVYDWLVVSGDLPTGLNLNRFTGEISGTVQAPPGKYTFTVQLKDDDELSTPVSKNLSIRVSHLTGLKATIP